MLESCDYTLTYPQLSDEAMALYTAITRARNQLYFIEVDDFGSGKKRKAGVPLADYALRRLSDLQLTKPVTSVDEGALEMSSAQHKARGVLLVTQAIAMSRRKEPFSFVAKKLQDAIERFSPANGNDCALERLANRSLQCLSDKNFLMTFMREKFYVNGHSLIMEGRFLDVLHLQEKLANYFETYGNDSFVKFEVAEIVQVVEEVFSESPYWSSFEEVCSNVHHLHEPIRRANKPEDSKRNSQTPASAPTAKRPSHTQERSPKGAPQPNPSSADPSSENRPSTKEPSSDASADGAANVASPRLNPQVATFTPGITGMTASIASSQVKTFSPLNAESTRTKPQVAASFMPSVNASSFVPQQLARPVPVSSAAPNPLYAAALASIGQSGNQLKNPATQAFTQPSTSFESASSGALEGGGQQYPADVGAGGSRPISSGTGSFYDSALAAIGGSKPCPPQRGHVSSPPQRGPTGNPYNQHGGLGYSGGNQYSSRQRGHLHSPPQRGPTGNSYNQHGGYSAQAAYYNQRSGEQYDGIYPSPRDAPTNQHYGYEHDYGDGYGGGNDGSYPPPQHGGYSGPSNYGPQGSLSTSHGYGGHNGAAYPPSQGGGYPGSSGSPNHGQGYDYYDGY